MSLSEVQTFTFLFQASHLPLPAAFFSKFGVLIGVLTTFFASINFTRDLLINPNPIVGDNNQIFDFIIGSGSSGGAIANRLSSNGRFNVLLLEAGGDPLVLNGIPYLFGANIGHQETDWMYRIVPQVNASLAIMEQSVPLARGKSVGGSSNLNSMVYMRGNPNDFDNWARLTQDKQWSYDNLLPFFKRLENYQGNFPNDPAYHGSEGPIFATVQRFQPMLNDWLKAGQELGFTSVDPNARQTSAFGPLDLSVSNGMRWEVYDGYIKPALSKKNLKIIRYARVTKINLDSHNRATGVNYVRNNQIFTAEASKEIIISAGSIGSPQLLMLSGIGPSEHLKSVGITPKVDLPGVGQNLMDHVGSLVGPFILNDSVSFISERDLSISSAVQYLRERSGPLTFPSVAGFSFISTTGESKWPNLLLFNFPIGLDTDFAQGTESAWRFRPGVYQKYLKGFVGRDATFVALNLVRPESRGSIRLRSKDPFDNPLIDPKYYTGSADIKAMVGAFSFAVKLLEETKSYQRYNATLIPNHFPGCEAFPLRTDAYYECFLRQFTTTNWHVASTCKMGRKDDPMAVLDSNLRVKYVRGLRVADASIMPVVTNANTNVPTIMIGEKAADLILKSWMA